MLLIKEKIFKIFANRLGEYTYQSNSRRKVYRCKYSHCKWKAIVYVVCRISQTQSDEVDLKNTHSGWLLFAAFSGKHDPIEPSNVNIVYGLETVNEIYEDHQALKYNACALECEEDKSVYKKPDHSDSKAGGVFYRYGEKKMYEI